MCYVDTYALKVIECSYINLQDGNIVHMRAFLKHIKETRLHMAPPITAIT